MNPELSQAGFGMDVRMTTLADKLKSAGYSTHQVRQQCWRSGAAPMVSGTCGDGTRLGAAGQSAGFSRVHRQHTRCLPFVCRQLGKWHLGLSAEAYLPVNRGFVSSFGCAHPAMTDGRMHVWLWRLSLRGLQYMRTVVQESVPRRMTSLHNTLQAAAAAAAAAETTTHAPTHHHHPHP
jgi:arylsulfatase A-like enzyme